MQGLELAERYWNQVGRPALAAACPEAAGRWAAGLVGEGSECFGCDDAISRDHDWGPGFCVWLTAEDHARWGRVLQDAYDRLPRRFEGFERDERPEGAGRVGVFEIGAFYRRFIGLDAPPRTVGQWMALDDEALATCTDGRVFEDGAGAFTAFREELLAFYPDDIRLKKLAARCALASQAGQYNDPRCVERGDAAAAFAALFRFIDNAQAAEAAELPGEALVHLAGPVSEGRHVPVGEPEAEARAPVVVPGDLVVTAEALRALAHQAEGAPLQGLRALRLEGGPPHLLPEGPAQLQPGHGASSPPWAIWRCRRIFRRSG